MNEKSFVSLEMRRCLVCARPFETDTLLFDRRLQKSLERHTLTGWGLCPEHVAKYNEGYLTLVEVSNAPPPGQDLVQPDEAIRTGLLAHVRYTRVPEIFNVKIPTTTLVVFVEPGVLGKLQAVAAPEDHAQNQAALNQKGTPP